MSAIIAGTMTWGTWGKNMNEQEMAQFIETCFEEGITTFDHADIYGHYTTEAAFGKAFAASNVKRSDVVFITKCGIQMLSPNRDYAVKQYDYSKKHIIESVENSLKNLRTDYVDSLLLHRPSPLFNIDEVAEVVNQLKQQGKVKAFGVSNFSPSQTQLAQKAFEVSINQIQFSLTNHSALTNGDLDFMRLHNIKPMAWNPLGTYFSAADAPLKETVETMAQRLNVTADLVLLAWILKHPAGISPVIGTGNIERIKALKNIPDLNEEDWYKLWEAARGCEVD